MTNTVSVWDNTKNSKAYAILLESGQSFRGCAIQTQVAISLKFNDDILLHVYLQGEFHTLTRETIHVPHWSSGKSFISRHYNYKLCCIKNDTNQKPSSHQDFSVLKTDPEYDSGNTWSTMAVYIFSLHIPLSFGGLSVVAKLLHQTVLDSETQVFSLLLIQTLELVAFMSLLQFSEKQFSILNFFETRVLPKERSWLLASVLGLGSLLTVVFLTSLAADKLIGTKDVNSPVLKEILSGGPLSVTGSILVYCLITPFLEETVYRGFLLTSLASRMEWKKAVVVIPNHLEHQESSSSTTSKLTTLKTTYKPHRPVPRHTETTQKLGHMDACTNKYV
ncbi:CAAX amino terminal protease family protein [Artemisia annua]|uniref:CAAX amino terminal protease family protein n=1 Tax=Artemisia annua TaxID=35608 RepID=A0A2U1LIE5_ARTAN|nr:CAAX amino terminal protease family protein [Artemisia annua]